MSGTDNSLVGRIRVVRKKLGITQGEFARRIGLSQNSMSMIEIGKSNLIEKNIKLICVTFNINETWLRTGKGEPFLSESPYEKELLDMFRQLPEETQDFVLEMARILVRKKTIMRRGDAPLNGQ